MKSTIRNTVIFLMTLLPVVIQGQTPFKAEMHNVKSGNKTIYQLQSDGTKYRYDFEEDGMKGIVIVDPVKGKTAILMPDKKFVHYTELTSGLSMANDPFQSFLNMRKRFTEKIIGPEKIYGYESEKSELYAGDQKLFTAWYSGKLNFLLKMINNSEPDTYMELSDIKPQKIDPAVFKVPEDYTVVDQRMRPVIPEPPPPDSWNTVKTTLPVKGEFKRGDLITFKVPENKNYKIILKNETGDPSKIIRISMRDGKELPDNEQGPLRYRTNRLFGGESSTNTYSWKAGDDKIIQVHEGKIHIEVVPEER
jgi:hypothetical protein